jgi:hypothetical protein
MIRGERVGEDDDKETAAQEADVQRRLAENSPPATPARALACDQAHRRMAIRALNGLRAPRSTAIEQESSTEAGKRML